MTRHAFTSMRSHGRRPAPLAAAVCAAAWAVACGSGVRGEDDQAVDDVPPVLQQLQNQQRGNVIDLGANFDTNTFQHVGVGFSLSPGGPAPAGDRSAASPAAAAARAIGEARLARIAEVCQLTEPQRRKLRLAMEADCRRLAEQIDAERRKYLGVAANLQEPEGQRMFQQFQQDVQRCRQQLQTLFGADSLFAKVLPTTLDPQQHARLVAETEARRAYRWKAMVAAAMLKFDDILGLDQRQHAAIEKLLLARQPRLRVDGDPARIDHNAPQTQQMLVWMTLSEIDAGQLQAAVSERQGRTLMQLANQGKAMRSFVEAQGILEKATP